MNKSLVSIIVPVFNAELYLEQCINSLINQSLENIEIILINDGSTDNSSEICKSYAEKDARIKYYEIPNGGVSNARNIGINYATSEWITFVDSDDWISLDYCKILADHIDNNVSLVIGRTFSFKDGKIIEDSFKGHNKHYFRTSNEKRILYESIVNDSPKVRKYPNLATCSAKLFRKKMIIDNSICYNTNLKYYEDAIFNIEAIFCSESVVIIPDVLYYYRLSNTSATQSYRTDSIEYYEKAFKEIFLLSKKDNLVFENDYYCFNIKNLHTIITNYFKLSTGLLKQHRFVKKICSREIFRKAIFKIDLKSIGFRRRVFLVIFVRFRLYWAVVYLYNRK